MEIITYKKYIKENTTIYALCVKKIIHKLQLVVLHKITVLLK